MQGQRRARALACGLMHGDPPHLGDPHRVIQMVTFHRDPVYHVAIAEQPRIHEDVKEHSRPSAVRLGRMGLPGIAWVVLDGLAVELVLAQVHPFHRVVRLRAAQNQTSVFGFQLLLTEGFSFPFSATYIAQPVHLRDAVVLQDMRGQIMTGCRLQADRLAHQQQRVHPDVQSLGRHAATLSRVELVSGSFSCRGCEGSGEDPGPTRVWLPDQKRKTDEPTWDGRKAGRSAEFGAVRARRERRARESRVEGL
eukprot:scaffold1188_cov255-Pinguiococcus_pyrenoidosus.AAC.3